MCTFQNVNIFRKKIKSKDDQLYKLCYKHFKVKESSVKCTCGIPKAKRLNLTKCFRTNALN